MSRIELDLEDKRSKTDAVPLSAIPPGTLIMMKGVVYEVLDRGLSHTALDGVPEVPLLRIEVARLTWGNNDRTDFWIIRDPKLTGTIIGAIPAQHIAVTANVEPREEVAEDAREWVDRFAADLSGLGERIDKRHEQHVTTENELLNRVRALERAVGDLQNRG